MIFKHPAARAQLDRLPRVDVAALEHNPAPGGHFGRCRKTASATEAEKTAHRKRISPLCGANENGAAARIPVSSRISQCPALRGEHNNRFRQNLPPLRATVPRVAHLPPQRMRNASPCPALWGAASSPSSQKPLSQMPRFAAEPPEPDAPQRGDNEENEAAARIPVSSRFSQCPALRGEHNANRPPSQR